MDAIDDGEFEVTAEMLIHCDVDDEQTLIEAEALESVGEVEEEIADLQQESELPLEELLKRYGYSFPGEPKADGEEERDEGHLKREKDRKRSEDESERVDTNAVKRVKVEDDHGILRGVNEEKRECSGLQCEVENVTYTEVCAQKKNPDKEDRPGSSVCTTGDDRKEMCTHPQFSTAISPAEPSSCSRMANCSSTTDCTSNKHIHRTKPIDLDSESKSVSEIQQSDCPILSPSSSLCNKEAGATDKWCAVGMLNSTAESSHFLSNTSSLDVGQPLLPEVSLEECESQLGDNGDLVQEKGGSDEVEGEGREGGGGGEVREVGDGEGREGGGGEGRGDSEGESGALEAEGGREVFCGENGGDVLLMNVKNTSKTKVQESSIKETGTDSSDMFSSDIRVHTPFTLRDSSSSSSETSRMHLSHTDIKSRLRPEVPERRSMRLMANDEKLDSYFSLYFDDEDGDEEYVPFEDWKQEIRVGSSYQVQVDDHPSHQPYVNRADPSDRLLWRPESPDETVVSYLKSVSNVVRPDSGKSSSWDTEQALQLLQECDHNTQRAMDVVQEHGLSIGARPWTEEECDNFEQGLRMSGKDFYLLKKQVPSRSVKELVEFYYFWKKSKRYDDFIKHEKIGKKKISFQPGKVADFMDNYLNMQDSEATDLHYATTTVYAEHKKETI